MNRITITYLAVIWLISISASASVFENLTITVTNTVGTTNGQLLTVNSDARTWTNLVQVPASQILTNSSASGAAANLRNHLGIYGFTGLKVYAFTSTSTTLRSGDGGHIVASLSAGWGTLTYTTNTYGTNVAVRVPLEGEPSPAQRTNIASGVGHMINSSYNTNLTLVWGTNVSGAVAQATHATNADKTTTATNAINATNVFGKVDFGLLTNGNNFTNGSLVVSNGTSLYPTNGGIIIANSLAVADGSSLTNLTLKYTTNAIPALVLTFGKSYFTNISANITLGAFAGLDVNAYESCVLMVTNSSGTDYKVTFPAGVWGVPGSGTPPAYYCTNQMLTAIVTTHYGGRMTNAIKIDYAP